MTLFQKKNARYEWMRHPVGKRISIPIFHHFLLTPEVQPTTKGRVFPEFVDEINPS